MIVFPRWRILPLAQLAGLAMICSWQPSAAADGPAAVVPSFDPGRYETLWTRSPFGVDTAPMVVAEAEGPSFAEGLVISGIARGEGKESLTLVNTRTKEFFRATTAGGGDYELISLTIERDRRKSRALIGKDGETAEVRFPEQNNQPIGTRSSGMTNVSADGERREAASRRGANPALRTGEGGDAEGEEIAARRLANPPSNLNPVTPPASPRVRRRVILPRQ